jgi:hypothetical protein
MVRPLFPPPPKPSGKKYNESSNIDKSSGTGSSYPTDSGAANIDNTTERTGQR